MKVQTKLIVGFSIVVLLIWVITFVANNTFTEIHEEFELLEEDIIPSAIAMSEIEILANEVARESTGYIYSGEEVAKIDSESLMKSFRELSDSEKKRVKKNAVASALFAETAANHAMKPAL